MKVKELAEQLSKFDPELEVLVSVRAYTRRYSVAQVSPWDVTGAYSACTLWVSLPDNMYVVERKAKP